jgi:hypothetical protein
MSSETSIDAGRSKDRPLRPPVGADLEAGPDADALQPWQLFTLAGLTGATIVVFMSRGQASPAAIILLSLTIFAAAAVGVAAWRTFSPVAAADEPFGGTVVGGRTRAALEREKALALRSIKELEFDRAMGKVSDKDFADMSARLRARAARLIRQLDAGDSYRDQIERELSRRLGGPDGPSLQVTSEGLPLPVTSRATSQARECASCRTVNDADARFCKSCGASLA